MGKPIIPARSYMLKLLDEGEHIDPTTDEINHTALAEDACDHLNLWEGDDTPDWLFDAAVDVADIFNRRRRRGTYVPSVAGWINSRPSTEL